MKTDMMNTDTLGVQIQSDAAPQVGLSIAVLVFGLLLFGGQILVMLKRQRGWGPSANQIVGLTIVITAGLFLITSGYSEAQIAPMIGLLGTIAGYLLGRGTDGSNTK